MALFGRTFLINLSRNEGVIFRSIKIGGVEQGVGGQRLARWATTRITSPPKPSWWKNYSKLVGLGFGAGALVSTAYMYHLYTKVATPIPNSSAGGQYVLAKKPPTFSPSRSIQIPTDSTGLKMTLFQFQTCPFCCKVRTFLDYFGLSYEVIEVNSVTRSQTRWTDYRKVPFLVVQLPNSEEILQLKDSTMIISVLQSFLNNKTANLQDLVKCYPLVAYSDGRKTHIEVMNRYFLMYGQHPSDRSQEDIVEERKWRKWVDDVFVHVLSPNVYRTPKEAFQAFEWFSKVGSWEEHFATWERLLVIYVGAVAMFFIGKNLKRRHQLKDDVRQSFYEETNVWLEALKKKGTKFMGGDHPNLSDLAVYGILTAVEGCEAFHDLKQNTTISLWFEHMRETVSQHGGAILTTEKGNVA
ncbi:prostaglandin E synthase 2 [Procambarus clarkii]|uniref:prostaglandin E synthase 2 n=1 Tax=Procambarus clarkii TaxID=6728 RepID=UPI00374466C5